MILPIVYPSAARFWLDGTKRKKIDVFNLENRSYSEIMPDARIAANEEFCSLIADKIHLDVPLHIMVSDNSERRKSKSCKCMIKPLNLPLQSFMKVGKVCLSEEINIYMASPEMCFMQAAKYLDFYDLIRLGTDLCAIYIFDAESRYSERSRRPIVNAEMIRTYVDLAGAFSGSKNARCASKYIQDNSNSPAETWIAMLSVLPYSNGGYALPFPELNGEVLLSKEAASFIGRDRLRGDMVWNERKVVVEYDSNVSHLDPSQHSYDKKRLTALELSGYKVISMTAQDFISVSSLDKAFSMIGKALGIRIREERLAKYHRLRQEILLRMKNSSSYVSLNNL